MRTRHHGIDVGVTKPPQFSADFTESTVSTKLAYDGGLLKVRRDEVRLHDGRTAWREYVEHPGAVMILAFVDAETILLERQYRYPKRRHFIELPAGKLERGEKDYARRQRAMAAVERGNAGRLDAVGCVLRPLVR